VERVKSIDRRVHDADLPHARCRSCHRDIVQVTGVGWLDPAPGDTYDLCPDSAYGDHEPDDARGDTAKSSGLLF
jgi:hypothetical protein